MKYNSDEARRLKNMGHLPDSVNVSWFWQVQLFNCNFYQIEFEQDDNAYVDFEDNEDEEAFDVPEQPYQPEIRFEIDKK